LKKIEYKQCTTVLILSEAKEEQSINHYKKLKVKFIQQKSEKRCENMAKILVT